MSDKPKTEANQYAAPSRIDSTDLLGATLRRLLRKTQDRPGGGRMDEYSQGYDKAKADFRKLIREEIKNLST